MLKWNAAKEKNFTGTEIRLFIIARMLIGVWPWSAGRSLLSASG